MIVRFAGLFKSIKTKFDFPDGNIQLKLIVGLGNPGRIYVDSRHNLGFRCLNIFARRHGIEFNKQRSKARIAVGEAGGSKFILAKPQTYMNLSGDSVRPLLDYYHIPVTDMLVVYDDVDLPIGSIRIRERGGAAGHNGMKSIIENVASQEFPRVRVGISPLDLQENVSHRNPDFVLGKFTREEKSIIDKVCPHVSEAIECILSDGITVAMNQYNSG